MMPSSGKLTSTVTSRSRVFVLAASLISGTMPALGCSTGYYLINYTSCDAATGACWGHSSSLTSAWLGATTPGANPVFTECCNIAYPGYYSAGGSVGVGLLVPCPGGTYGSQTGLANARCTGNCTAGYFCPPGSVTATQNICSPGSFCPSGASAQTPCPGGTFGATSGLTSAACSGSCTAGFYCPAGSNASTAVVCSMGSYCPGGSSAPLLCPAETFGNVTGLTTPTCSGPCACCNAGATSLTTPGTCSQTPTFSMSATESPSPTSTASVTASLTCTPSTSLTPSSSGSPSETSTPSATQSGSETSTQSSSASATGTPSPSGSPSMSETATTTASQTQTPSPSQTNSITATRSLTQSPSLSKTASGTSSQSQTPTSTQTRSNTATPSTTMSPSQSGTATTSTSLTQTPTATLSPSQTPSSSGTPSRSTTHTPSSSSTATPSHSATSSQSPSQSRSQSPSMTASATPTPSQTQTGSASSTPSLTQTPTTSLRPFALSVAVITTTGYTPSSATISDSLEPVHISLTLSRCPVAFPSETAICVVQPYSGGLSANGAAASLNVVVAPSLAGYFDLSPCATIPFAPVLLPLRLAIGAAMGSGGGGATLVCELVAGSSKVARGVLQLDVQPTLWPLWDDAIVVAPSLAAGGAFVIRSTRLGVNINATALLLTAYCGRSGAIVSNASSDDVNSCSVAAAAGDAAAVFAAVMSANAVSSLPNASVIAATFASTLVGPQRVVLRAAAVHAPAFARGVTVTLGGVPCTVEAVSSDGAWLMFTAPTPAALCNSTEVDCGYAPLSVANPSTDRSSRPSSTDAFRSPVPYRGAALACPPFCPGGIGLGVPMAGPGSGGASFVPGVVPDAGGLPQPDPAAPSAGATSQGFYYAAACDASGFYVSPALGACANASDPASYGCAWGSGASCQVCPVGALCPGGTRLWPRAGYWAPAESSAPSALSTCPPPNARCVGWGVLTGATQCGPGYRQGSSLCSACADKFFHTDDGVCAACPVIPSLWARYSGLVYIVLAIAGTVAAFCALFRAVTWSLGVPGVGGLVRLLNLGIWALMVAQVVSDVAVASSQSLPPYLAALYARVIVLQMQGVLVPPACTGAYAFEGQVASMALALAAWTTAAAVFYLVPPHAKLIRLVGGQCALLGAFLLYASTTSTAISLVYCSSVSVAASAAAGFDGGAAVAASSATSSATGARVSSSAVVSLSVLVSQPSFVCWAAGGSHRPAGVLALVTLAWYVACMPALTLWWLVRDPWVRARRSAATAALAAKGQRVVALPRVATATSLAAGGSSGVSMGGAALESSGAKYFKRAARQSTARRVPLARALRSAVQNPAEISVDVSNPLRQAATSSAQSRGAGAGRSVDAAPAGSAAPEAPHTSRGGGRLTDSESATFSRTNPLRDARAASAAAAPATDAAADSEARAASEARSASVGPGSDDQRFETANPLKAAGRRPASPQLRAALRKSSAAAASGRAADPLVQANPLRLALASPGSASDPATGPPSSQRTAVRAARVSDAGAVATQESIDGGGLPPDPILQVFFFDYRPAAGWYMRHVELGLLLVLSSLRALLPWPTTVGTIALKAALLGSALLAALIVVLVVRPFHASEAWMGWVRALLLIDSLLCVALNAAAGAVAIGLGGAALERALASGAVVAFAACVLTFTVLFCGVAWHVYADARAERRRADAARARLRRLEKQRMRVVLAGAVAPPSPAPPASGAIPVDAQRRTPREAAATPPPAARVSAPASVRMLGLDDSDGGGGGGDPADASPFRTPLASHRSLSRGSALSSRVLVLSPLQASTPRIAGRPASMRGGAVAAAPDS